MPDRSGGVDAVHLAGQMDVHQHQFGMVLAGERDGFFALHGHVHGVVPEVHQLPLDVSGNDAFVFDDQDASHRNESMAITRVPGWLSPWA